MLNPFNLPSASVTDTEAATLHIAAKNRCSVTILDDVKSSRSRRCIQTLETLVRVAGDEFTASGRKIGASVETIELSNLIVATGEIKPPLQPSSIARMLVLEFDKNTISVDRLKKIQVNPDFFRRFTRSFILYFIHYALKTGWIDTFITRANARERQLQGSINFRHGRYYRMVAWLECAWESIVEFCKQYGTTPDC